MLKIWKSLYLVKISLQYLYFNVFWWEEFIFEHDIVIAMNLKLEIQDGGHEITIFKQLLLENDIFEQNISIFSYSSLYKLEF